MKIGCEQYKVSADKYTFRQAVRCGNIDLIRYLIEASTPSTCPTWMRLLCSRSSPGRRCFRENKPVCHRLRFVLRINIPPVKGLSGYRNTRKLFKHHLQTDVFDLLRQHFALGRGFESRSAHLNLRNFRRKSPARGVYPHRHPQIDDDPQNPGFLVDLSHYLVGYLGY